MHEHGFKADIRQKKHNLQRQVQQYKEDNLLKRRFNQPLPNLVWVTDTTELSYGVGNKVRLHAVLDLHGRYVIIYLISPTETADAAIEVFK